MIRTWDPGELKAHTVDALTEAVLDHEHQLQRMTDVQRERYRPMAVQRAEFIADHLDQRGWTMIPPRDTRPATDRCSASLEETDMKSATEQIIDLAREGYTVTLGPAPNTDDRGLIVEIDAGGVLASKQMLSGIEIEQHRADAVALLIERMTRAMGDALEREIRDD